MGGYNKRDDRIDYSLDISLFEAKSLHLPAESKIYGTVSTNDIQRTKTKTSDKCKEPFWGHSSLVIIDNTFRNLTVTLYRENENNSNNNNINNNNNQNNTNTVANTNTNANNNNNSVRKFNAKNMLDTPIGSFTFPASFISTQSDKVEQWYTLNKEVDITTGSFAMRSLYLKESNGDIRLSLYLQHANDLLSTTSTALPNPFAVLCPIPCDEKFIDLQQTNVYIKDDSPTIQRTYEFLIKKESKYEAIYISFWDNKPSPNEFLGEVVIPLTDFKEIGLTNKLRVHQLKPKVNYTILKNLGGKSRHDFDSVYARGKCNACNKTFTGMYIWMDVCMYVCVCI